MHMVIMFKKLRVLQKRKRMYNIITMQLKLYGTKVYIKIQK